MRRTQPMGLISPEIRKIAVSVTGAIDLTINLRVPHLRGAKRSGAQAKVGETEAAISVTGQRIDITKLCPVTDIDISTHPILSRSVSLRERRWGTRSSVVGGVSPVTAPTAFLIPPFVDDEIISRGCPLLLAEPPASPRA